VTHSAFKNRGEKKVPNRQVGDYIIVRLGKSKLRLNDTATHARTLKKGGNIPI